MISEEQVRHVANLARLGLSDEEVGRMGGQLDAILESIEKIGELDLADVPPTSNPLELDECLASRRASRRAAAFGGALQRP